MSSPLSCLLVVLGSSHAARILGIFPTPSVSHQLPFQAVMKTLASRGHRVTVVSTDPLKSPHPNYTDVDLSFTYKYWRSEYEFEEMDELNPYQMMATFSDAGPRICHLQLASTQMQTFIKSNPKFDLVLIESLMYYQPYYGLVHHVGSPPLIGIVSMGGMAPTFVTAGNPNNPSYSPDVMWDYDDHMTFFQRANNMVYILWVELYWRWVMMPKHEAVMRQYFGEAPPSVYEVEKNYSLVMVNNHWSVSYPRPLLPGYIELGGLHLQTANKPLPKDLAEFLDGATEGFIYFSLGSNVRSDKLPARKRQQFLDAFAALPQRVLWKWESDTLPGQPENVKLSKWLPQQDVLAHPNIRLFVTQGGLQSVQEAIDNAVPLVGIHFMGDQKHNIRKVVCAGVGLQLNFKTATKESILKTIKTVIEDPSYRDKMKILSAVNKDQPETPLQRAVWWTEYVLRHDGARHLRPASVDLAWYQYLLLDVFALLAVILTLALFVCYLATKKLSSSLLGPRTKSKTKSE